MNRQAIESAIPHRPPMLLLDEVVQADEQQIICRKTFRADEFFVQGHYPDYPLVPGVILCECAMQAGGVLLAQIAGSADGVPVATRMNNVRFRNMVRPGESVEIHVQFVERLANAYFLKAKVQCQGKTAVQFDFACALVAVNAD